MRVEIHVDGKLAKTFSVDYVDMYDDLDLMIRSDMHKEAARRAVAQALERMPRLDNDPFIDIYVVYPSKINRKK